jgi:endonuclease G
VAALSRHAMSSSLDAAVASLNGKRPLLNDQLGLGPLRGVGQARLGMNVMKSGRRTDVTSGRVTAVEGIAKIKYGQLYRTILHVLTIEPRSPLDPVSGPGDSGSCWVEQGSMNAIGLHFAGSDSPERALALSMPAVLDALEVDLVVEG